MYRLPLGMGPGGDEVPWKGTPREPLILPVWIGCEPYPVPERIEPGNKLLVVVVCICVFVASSYVSR